MVLKAFGEESDEVVWCGGDWFAMGGQAGRQWSGMEQAGNGQV